MQLPGPGWQRHWCRKNKCLYCATLHSLAQDQSISDCDRLWFHHDTGIYAYKSLHLLHWWMLLSLPPLFSFVFFLFISSGSCSYISGYLPFHFCGSPFIHYVVCYKPSLVWISLRNLWFNQHPVFYIDTKFDLFFISSLLKYLFHYPQRTVRMSLIHYYNENMMAGIPPWFFFPKFILISTKGFESSKISYVAL